MEMVFRVMLDSKKNEALICCFQIRSFEWREQEEYLCSYAVFIGYLIYN